MQNSREADPSDAEGQVSEVGRLDPADVGPVSDDQSVAGAPEAESGDVQEGRQGPNARTGSEHGEV